MMPGERADDSGADDTAAPRPSTSGRDAAADADVPPAPQGAVSPRTSAGAAAAAAAALRGRSVPTAEERDAQVRQDARREGWRGLDQGSIMSVELLTATLVWFGIGWLVDSLLGTMPWFMFAGALLGNWVGLYLLWLRGQRAENAARDRAQPPPDGADQRADR